MSPSDEKAKKQLCQVLHKIGAIEFGTFKLTSGKTSPYYIDLRIVPSFPEAFRSTCDLFVRLIRDEVGLERFQRIAGVPTAGMLFASVAAYNLKKPMLYTRKALKTHGRKRRVEGVLLPGDRVLLVDDVVTSGKSMLQAASAIRAEGGVVDDAIVLIDREEDGIRNMAEEKIQTKYFVKISEVAKMLHTSGAISNEELTAIQSQMESKQR